MKTLFTLCFVFSLSLTYAQVGIGTATPNAKAALDISATGKGFLIPRMDSVARVDITNPPDGLMVFQTDGRKGFWYALSNAWLYIPDKLNSGDNLGSHVATQNVATNNYDVLLRAANDANHGLGWYGNSNSTKNWLGQNIDGPVLYGADGGALGTKAGTPASVLTWRSNGRVGINNSSPQHALDVTGTARAQQFSYSTPQTRYLSIPLDAFSSVSPGAYRSERTVGDNAGYFSVALSLSGGTAGQEGFVSAPVNLPHGAIITNLELSGVNNDATIIHTEASLSALRITHNSVGYSYIILANTIIPTESNLFQVVSTPLSHMVQNDLYSYKVIVRLNQNNGGTSLQRVRITYTITQPE